MSIKQFIISTAKTQALKAVRSVGDVRKVQSQSKNSGLATVLSIEDGKYIVELPDKSTKEITPMGRAVGPGGQIIFSGDFQVY